ncbi:MAG: FecR domain-containing protein [Acidobacteriota bacterium]
MGNWQEPEKPTILLDWFNVSYRTLLAVCFGALLIVGGASYATYVKYFYQESPKAAARAAINQAEENLHKTGPVGEEEAATEFKQAAQGLLEEARRQFDAKNFLDARKAAVESNLNAEKAIALVRGELAREVQFYHIEGDVKVKRARELIWVDAKEGMSLSVGDQVKTSSRSTAQIIYFNGTITTVNPGSLLEIKTLYDNQVTKVQRVRERLRQGKIAASTQEGVKGSFHEVATHNAVAKSTHRTNFSVEYDKNASRTHVEVRAGRATLLTGRGKQVEVHGSEMVDVDRKENVSAVKHMKPVPRMSSPPDQKIFLIREGKGPSVDLAWQKVRGATGYRLQISSKPLFADPEVDIDDMKTTSATLPNVKQGGYYWRVAAMFSSGPGPFSNPRRFKVMPARMAQDGDDEPPPLVIDDFLVFSSQVIIRGRTEPGTLLTVGGNKVDVYDDGSFTTVVSLTHEGVNRVTFLVQDMAGNERRVDRMARVDPY